jgi:tetratricopeptide (TPR) repeat protein
MYLLDETDETQAMRQDILQMLGAGEEENVNLALQLIDSGGVHREFIGVMFALYLCAWDEGILERMKYLKKLLKRVVPLHHLDSFRRYIRKRYYLSQVLDSIIENLGKGKLAYIKPYWAEMVAYIYDWKGYLASYCLNNNFVQAEKIINNAIAGNTLYLSYYELEDLPDALAQVKVDYLYLMNNPLSKVRRKKWQNDYVQEFFFDDENLSSATLKFIGQCFPKAMKKKFQKLENLLVGLLKCMPKERRGMKFYKICAQAYKREQQPKVAIKIYQKLAVLYPYPEEIWNFRIAECYACLQDEVNMLKYLAYYIEETSYDVEKDIDLSKDFETYYEHPEVLKLIHGAKKQTM